MVEEVKEDRVEIKPEFLKELMNLINRHSIENGSNTPDYMLAAFLGDILQAFSSVVRQRDEWHGFKPFPRPETPQPEDEGRGVSSSELNTLMDILEREWDPVFLKASRSDGMAYLAIKILQRFKLRESHHDTLDNFIKKKLGIEKPTPEDSASKCRYCTHFNKPVCEHMRKSSEFCECPVKPGGLMGLLDDLKTHAECGKPFRCPEPKPTPEGKRKCRCVEVHKDDAARRFCLACNAPIGADLTEACMPTPQGKRLLWCDKCGLTTDALCNAIDQHHSLTVSKDGTIRVVMEGDR